MSSLTNNVTSFSHLIPSAAVCWDPHAPHCAAVSHSSSLQLLDTRTQDSMTVTNCIDYAAIIRDVDYNPNKPHTLLACGDDRSIRIYDTRRLSSSTSSNPITPLLTLSGHSHTVHTAKYNPFHDQLLLSGGSDDVVNLWRIASCSSSPWIASTESGDKNNDTDDTEDPPDVKVSSMDQQHEDSVYSVAWSASDAWIYCSLSYDGRLVINHVPSTEKYKILL